METASGLTHNKQSQVEIRKEKVKTPNRYSRLLELNSEKKDSMNRFMNANGVTSYVLANWRLSRTSITPIQNSVIDRMIKTLKLIEK